MAVTSTAAEPACAGSATPSTPANVARKKSFRPKWGGFACVIVVADLSARLVECSALRLACSLTTFRGTGDLWPAERTNFARASSQMFHIAEALDPRTRCRVLEYGVARHARSGRHRTNIPHRRGSDCDPRVVSGASAERSARSARALHRRRRASSHRSVYVSQNLHCAEHRKISIVLPSLQSRGIFRAVLSRVTGSL